jgi:hypothetical protein
MPTPSSKWLVPFVVGVAACTYLLTACPYVLGGDNGEYATLFATGGVAHPPGFPLYVLLLRAFRFLPARSPAHGAALVTAALGAAAVFATARACRAFGASNGATAVATAAFASSALLWKLSTHAEVFAPSALAAGTILALSGPECRLRAERRAAALGLVAGFGLSLHPSLVLFAPSGLFAFAASVRESKSSLRAVLLGLAALIVGPSPYVALLETARHADPQVSWVWGNVHDLPTLLSHFRRADYGTLSLSLRGGKPTPWVHVPRLFAHAVRELLGLPVVAIAVVAALVVPRFGNLDSSRRAPLAVLLVTFIFVGPAFVAAFNRPLTDVGPSIVERFYLLPLVPLTVLGAVGLDLLLPSLIDGAAALALAPLTLGAGFALSSVDEREASRPSVEYYVENVLGSLPGGAVVFGSSDYRFGGFLYASRALKLRPDVAFVSPRLLNASWYRAQTSRRLGVAIDAPHGNPPDMTPLIATLLRAARPVALAGANGTRLAPSFVTYPLGAVVRVFLPGTAAPSPERLEPMNLDVFSRFRLERTAPASPDDWPALVALDYATPWLTLADAFTSEGKAERAAACRARAMAFAPWL